MGYIEIEVSDAQRIRENGYSVAVHHEDGTSTTTHVTPEEIAQRRAD
jgi:hypothetical protein